MTHPFDGRPIKRVRIGTDPVSTRSPAEEHAQRLADRAATESRLKAAEGLWRTIQQAAGGGAVPVDPPAAAGNPETGEMFASPGVFGWVSDADDFLY